MRAALLAALAFAVAFGGLTSTGEAEARGTSWGITFGSSYHHGYRPQAYYCPPAYVYQPPVYYPAPQAYAYPPATTYYSYPSYYSPPVQVYYPPVRYYPTWRSYSYPFSSFRFGYHSGWRGYRSHSSSRYRGGSRSSSHYRGGSRSSRRRH